MRMCASARATLLAIAAIACAGGLLALAPAPASAHTPVLERPGPSDAPWKAPSGIGPALLFPGAQDLPDPRVSRAVYGTLAAGEAFDAYRFAGPEDANAAPVEIPVELLVPVGAGNERLRPTLVIVGYGTDRPDALPSAIVEHLRSVQATVPLTVVADPGPKARGSEYEPFVGETLQKGATARITVEPGRVYYALVFDPAHAAGEYRLVVGEAEAFTVGEALATPAAVLRIKLGLYGQDRIDWAFAAILAIAVLAIGGGIGALVMIRRRRRTTG